MGNNPVLILNSTAETITVHWANDSEEETHFETPYNIPPYGRHQQKRLSGASYIKLKGPTNSFSSFKFIEKLDKVNVKRKKKLL